MPLRKRFNSICKYDAVRITQSPHLDSFASAVMCEGKCATIREQRPISHQTIYFRTQILSEGRNH